MSILTPSQVKVLAFNAVGRGAETKNFSPYVLGWAGNESGLSIGYMQWDFRQRLSASNTASLLSRYNTCGWLRGQVSHLANGAPMPSAIRMVRSLRVEYSGAVYHVTSRGRQA